MLIEMNIFISALKKVTMLVLDLSHYLHPSPFIHFTCKIVLIRKVVTISFLILEWVF